MEDRADSERLRKMNPINRQQKLAAAIKPTTTLSAPITTTTATTPATTAMIGADATTAKERKRSPRATAVSHLLARAQADDVVDVGQRDGALGAVGGHHDLDDALSHRREGRHDLLFREVRVEGDHLFAENK